MTLPVDQVFELLPAWFRSRDSGLVAGVALLTAAEQAELTALLAVVNPDLMQQARLDYLVAKRDRGPLASLIGVIAEQVACWNRTSPTSTPISSSKPARHWVIPYIGDLIGYRACKMDSRQRSQRARRSGQHDGLPPAQGYGDHARSSPRATSPAGARARSNISSAWAPPRANPCVCVPHAPDLRRGEALDYGSAGRSTR